MTGVERIAAERQRQIEVEGYDAEHDRYADAHLAAAAACYAMPPAIRLYSEGVRAPVGWPWDDEFWKPGERIRELEKAGALIAAALDARAYEDADKVADG